ncbi:hypothetical protein AAC387_Pa01g3732 [Persea americana]
MERFLYSLVGDVEMVLDFLEEMEKMLLPPARSYVKNTKAMFRTPADVYEHPDSYHFVLDMPGLQVENIKVKVENGVLHVVGKKKKRRGEGEGRSEADTKREEKSSKQAEEAPSKPKTITIPVS